MDPRRQFRPALQRDTLYIRAYLTSIWNAAVATFLCLLIGYPMALGITRVSKSWRNILLMLVILPFWTSFLLRVYAWMGLLGNNSWFNRGLTSTRQCGDALGMGAEVHPDDEHQFRRRPGDGLFLSALHDPAALRQSREARHDAQRGGDGPGVEALAGVQGRDAAAQHSRHHRGRASRLHSGKRRTHHPEPCRQCVRSR